MMRMSVGYLMVMIAPPASAQDMPDRGPTIEVVGQGKVAAQPDTAQIDYWVLGEGRTADDASHALADKQRAIVAGLSGLLGGDVTITGSEVGVIEARNPQCTADREDNRPLLSEGRCATTGYVARIQGMVRTGRIDRAATAIGLAGRLGARDARLQGYSLADDRAARRAAIADAVRNANEQATALATAAGATLGPVMMLRDQTHGGYDTIVVTGSRARMPAAPAMAVAPPVEIAVTPRPIEIRANVQMAFRIVSR